MNYNLKRWILGVIIAFCALCASAQVERGEKMLGVRVGYATENRSVDAGITFRYAIVPWVRIAPEIGCVFRNRHKDAFTVDLNFQVPFSFDSDKVDLYPLVGVAYNSWSTHYNDIDGNDVSSRLNRIGANLGAGFDIRMSSTLNLGIEAKYTFVKTFTSLYLTASISYVF